MIFNLDLHSEEIEQLKKDVAGNTSGMELNKQTLGYTSKNLLKNEAKTQTVNGVTFTVNEDKSVTLKGNKEAKATSLILNSRIDLTKGETYIISRGLSSGNDYPMITSDIKKSNGTSINDGFKTAGANVFKCEEDGCYIANVRIWLGSVQATYNNITLYPMIRHASILDDTYEPYRENVDERLNNTDTRLTETVNTLGGCHFKYENGKFYIGHEEAESEV